MLCVLVCWCGAGLCSACATLYSCTARTLDNRHTHFFAFGESRCAVHLCVVCHIHRMTRTPPRYAIHYKNGILVKLSSGANNECRSTLKPRHGVNSICIRMQHRNGHHSPTQAFNHISHPAADGHIRRRCRRGATTAFGQHPRRARSASGAIAVGVGGQHRSQCHRQHATR